MDHVGKTVRQLREERGLNQAQLAVAIGTGPSAISQIENGKRNPNSETLVKLARALEVGVGDLFPKAQAPLRLDFDTVAVQSGEDRAATSVWKEEYLARANEMLVKWEGELEEKLSLAESDLVRLFDWLEEVRELGRPLMAGVVSGYSATCGYRLEALAGAAQFLDPWDNLWLCIEERLIQTTKLSEEDEKRFRELYENARAVG